MCSCEEGGVLSLLQQLYITNCTLFKKNYYQKNTKLRWNPLKSKNGCNYHFYSIFLSYSLSYVVVKDLEICALIGMGDFTVRLMRNLLRVWKYYRVRVKQYDSLDTVRGPFGLNTFSIIITYQPQNYYRPCQINVVIFSFKEVLLAVFHNWEFDHTLRL